ncbi:MerR family transcriptional regulator [Cryptosporangium sp. NPDC051539]|uniref:MerR family transcriptional regulator n=1 Tax=Cryptosporangium sp. NPDC051539 TaxID=3363962 RepID=UPI0037B6A2CB
MITIGQVAAYAGVSVRTVRYYHQRGLLAEPERDGSGYRRYGPQQVIDLVQITTLAAAGVPLARIRQLRTAEAAEFTQAINEIDYALSARITELTAARHRVRALTAGDRLYVPELIADYLDALRAAGASERYLRIERDLWMLAWAVEPDVVTARIRERSAGLADPAIRALLCDFDRAFDAEPSDPALEDIARRLVDLTVSRSGWDDSAFNGGSDFQALVRSAVCDQSPGWDKLQELARERFARLRPSDPGTSYNASLKPSCERTKPSRS